MKKHLNSLIRKHRMLDQQIANAKLDTKQVRKMKRLRLILRDRISVLQRGPVRSAARAHSSA